MNSVAASLTVALFGTTLLWNTTDGLRALTAESARRIDAAQQRDAVPQLTLTTMSGAKQKLLASRGNATLVNFIYTTCPTICKINGDDIARLRDSFVAHGLSDKVRIFSISFDPTRDNTEALAAYGEAHSADNNIWTIARPDPEDLPKLLSHLGVVVISDGRSGFEHNAAVHVIDRAGRLTAILDTFDTAGIVLATRAVLQ